jgi:outer membrane protein assembly factor BamB
VVIGLAILPGANAYTAEPTKIARADADQSRAPQAGNQIFVPMVGVSQLLPSPTPTRTRTPSPTALPTTTPLPTATPYSGGTGAEWAMLAANPQRTSWTPEEVRGGLGIQWYRPIEPYISYKIQPVAANGKIYVSTARGLYAFNASNGNIDWVYPTELPLGHSPTIAKINNVSTAFVGGYDHKVHALNAMTGQKISGYTSYEAGAGFETNPLVINDAYVANTIFAGNRDGYFYALDAVTGALKWRVQTGGAILYSAAYKNGVVYFASNDMSGYALNAANGALVWKSAKLLGEGFHSYWPVIYTHKSTNKDYVIFSSGENYSHSMLSLPHDETAKLFANIPVGNLIGATGTVAGDWVAGTVTIDAGVIANYYENYPHRRTVFVLDRTNGQEYTFDSNSNGKPEYAPFSLSGAAGAGNRYPPIVNGIDGVYYQQTAYYNGGWVSRGAPVGWKFGTKYLSQIAEGSGTSDTTASDEPTSYSSGGRMVYFALCCDRVAGGYDVTIPYGQANRAWTIYGSGFVNQAPNYQMMYNDGDATLYNAPDGWQIYSGMNQSKNGIYGKHGMTQAPPVPYQGKLYFLKGNALLAFSPNASSTTQLATATVVPASSPVTAPPTTELKQRLENEIQKMLTAGHLRPGYRPAGFLDLYGLGWYDDEREYGEIFDYFQNPADTVVALIQALPHLSPTMQTQVKTYLQTNYGPGATYSFTRIVHMGYRNGAAREAFETPAEALNTWGGNGRSPLDPQTYPICGGCGYWSSFPPYSFYAAWKYAQVFGGAKSIFDSMSTKLNTPPSDAYLIKMPYILHLYIAGYQGYLELQKLAGYAENASARATYNRLLTLRVTNFSKDTPYYKVYTMGYINYSRALSVARNFMFLTPELGDYMSQQIRTQVQTAVNEYNYVAPYWFVSNYDSSYGEGTYQPLYDVPAMFQAKAYILKQPASELARWLDVPGFYRGDLFYIQNLVAVLNAPAQ